MGRPFKSVAPILAPVAWSKLCEIDWLSAFVTVVGKRPWASYWVLVNCLVWAEPLAGSTQSVLGLGIHKVVIPVAAGRNLAVLLEAAVRNTILKLRGIDTMEDFQERQRRAMDS